MLNQWKKYLILYQDFAGEMETDSAERKLRRI